MKMKRKAFPASPSIATLLVGAGIIATLAYGVWVALPFIEGPRLALDAPEPTGSGTVIIRGITARVSSVSVNGLVVPLSDDGTFSVERAYPAGYTVVIVEAVDRFGRRRTEELTFVTKDSDNHASKEESIDGFKEGDEENDSKTHGSEGEG
ncbi:MAG: hypothetical protein ACE5F4_02560 [Candidatus Paceibacteria bacterium]